MKKLLTLFLSAFILVGCASTQSYTIDKAATAAAPWEGGEIFPSFDTTGILTRTFLGVTTQGYYLVQDTYDGSQEADGRVYQLTEAKSDPYLVINEEAVASTDLLFHGPYKLTLDNGNTYRECELDHGTSIKPCISYDEQGKKMLEVFYVNGIRHGAYAFWGYCSTDLDAKPCGGEIGQYCDGSPYCGIWTRWYNDGEAVRHMHIDWDGPPNWISCEDPEHVYPE